MNQRNTFFKKRNAEDIKSKVRSPNTTGRTCRDYYKKKTLYPSWPIPEIQFRKQINYTISVLLIWRLLHPESYMDNPVAISNKQRLVSSDKAQFETAPFISIFSRYFSIELKINIPPGPVPKIFPVASIFNPSGPPPSFLNSPVAS